MHICLHTYTIIYVGIMFVSMGISGYIGISQTHDGSPTAVAGVTGPSLLASVEKLPRSGSHGNEVLSNPDRTHCDNLVFKIGDPKMVARHDVSTALECAVGTLTIAQPQNLTTASLYSHRRTQQN